MVCQMVLVFHRALRNFGGAPSGASQIDVRSQVAKVDAFCNSAVVLPAPPKLVARPVVSVFHKADVKTFEQQTDPTKPPTEVPAPTAPDA